MRRAWGIGRLLLVLASPAAFVDAGDCVIDPQASLPADALPDEIDASLKDALRRSLLNFENCLPSTPLDAQSNDEAASQSSSTSTEAAASSQGDSTAPSSTGDAKSSAGEAEPSWAGDDGSDGSGSQSESEYATRGPTDTGSRSGQVADVYTDPSSADGGGCPDGSCGSPYVDDDVARALRARAEQETDPAIQQELWRVYRDYVENAAQ